VEDDLGARVVEEPGRVVHRRQVVVDAARDDDLVARSLEPLDEVRAEEASAACDERAHRRRVSRSAASVGGSTMAG
jgi:hypothetical protein